MQNNTGKQSDSLNPTPTSEGMLLTDEEKKVTAYHESGHALVSYLLSLIHI